MKVAFCVALDLNCHGGVERHIFCHARAMRGLGVDVDVYGATAPLCDGADEFGRLGTLEPGRYRVIHSHGGLISGGFTRLLADRRRGQRHVHTMHNVHVDYLVACCAWLNWRCYWATVVEGAWCRFADHVIAVSDHVRDWAVRHYRIDPWRISTVPNGYAPAVGVKPAREETRQKLGLGDGDFAMLFVGRCYDKVKGADVVSAAVADLHQRFPHVRLIAVPGDGFDDAPWLVRTGPVDHGDMREYYAASDVFVNASLSEGAPLTLIEAMAARLAVVASPVGGIPEVVRSGHNGLLLSARRDDLAEKVKWVVENRERCRKFAENARLDVEKLTWDNLAAATLAVYESLLV